MTVTSYPHAVYSNPFTWFAALTAVITTSWIPLFEMLCLLEAQVAILRSVSRLTTLAHGKLAPL